jgi:hypothetical protein
MLSFHLLFSLSCKHLLLNIASHQNLFIFGYSCFADHRNKYYRPLVVCGLHFGTSVLVDIETTGSQSMDGIEIPVGKLEFLQFMSDCQLLKMTLPQGAS